jgi:hypothetical protein
MPHFTKAVEEAIKGGWALFDAGPVEISTNGSWPMIGAQHNGVYKMWPVASALIDSTFFQALGRARGWGAASYIDTEANLYPRWQYAWHRFIDHLADGKDAESFFAAL